MKKIFIGMTSLFCAAAVAAGPEAAKTVMAEEAIKQDSSYDADALFEEYAERTFKAALPEEDTASHTYEAPRYEKLSNAEKRIYEEIRSAVTDIADGRRSDARVKFAVNQYWHIDNEMLMNVYNALIVDLPYEMYWHDRGSISYGVYDNGEGEIDFSVIPNYSADGTRGTCEADTAKTGKAQAAVSRAKSIAAQGKALEDDYEALHYFKEQICTLVTYDFDAAETINDSSRTDLGPVQLINVFDGDPSTNVVCEGYSKAFKYLCDLYGFSTEATDCYIVDGMLYDSFGGSVGHMWNVVHWNDGSNYLVDVTNCDADDVPTGTDEYFLVGATEIEKENYNGVLRTSRYEVDYLGWDYFFYYTDGTKSSPSLNLYTEDEIGIATHNLRSNEGEGTTDEDKSPDEEASDKTAPSDDSQNTDTPTDQNEPADGETTPDRSEEEHVLSGWEESGDSSYWYEDGVRQGTLSDPKGVWYDGTNRGREIYDPGSDGWYWLDAVYDGAKAVGKEVFMPYIYQDEKSWDDAEIRANANASDDGMQDYVYSCIKNGTGKWVRYDEDGRMLKGWVTIEGRLAELYPDQAGNTYYYDNKTGLMAKGWITLSGQTYHFDETTGALIR